MPTSSSYLREFKIKSGDTAPDIEADLTDGDGNVVDLTGVTAIRFHMRPVDDDGEPTGPMTVDAAATIVGDPADGRVAYSWQTGDTDTPGVYGAEWEVLSAGKITTFPNDHNNTVIITPALG